MSTDKETAIKLGGAKRKNGHKMDCDCHICDNMKNKAKRGGYREDAEKEELKKNGGSKKKNGHKPNCSCPICKNMRNAKGKTMKAGKGSKTGKRSNGHKINCGCPICKNMSKKNKKGGDSEEVAPEDEYDDLDDIPTATTQPVISDEDKKNANSESSEMATQPATNNLSSMSATEDELSELSSSRYEPNKSGGRRRKTMRKSMKKRSNGHKANCGCPICKNMRKGKTRRR
jgi:hypothetical protein